MVYLVDTNAILSFAHRTYLFHEITREAVRILQSDEHQFTITPQNCIEFWNVATRPTERTGYGKTTEETTLLLQMIESLFPLIADSSAIYSEWRRLVVQHNISGVKVHDARLVAVMKTNAITHILTFNDADFARYASEGIVPVNPKNV